MGRGQGRREERYFSCMTSSCAAILEGERQGDMLDLLDLQRVDEEEEAHVDEDGDGDHDAIHLFL